MALILVRSSSTSDYIVRGTGALINNGNQDLRPLFITAAHNYNDTWGTNAQFMFHYRSPQCSPTSNGPTTLTVQGANNLAPGHGPTDLKLVELKTNPGTHPVFSTNPVSYLGWSIIDEIKPVNGIHHPLGDVQKYFSGTNVQVYNESIGTGNYFYWKFDLISGIFQPVSSGSPILNDSKRLISALRGRLSSADPYACGASNVDAIGGRLSAAWSVFCQYLDPSNEGIVAINTITNTSGPSAETKPNILGPSQACYSSTSSIFTMQNAPLDLIVTWSIVQGASLLSSPSSGTGKSASLTVKNSTVSGQVKIRFSISGLCSNKTYDKVFYVGKPSVTGIEFANPVDEYGYFCSSDYGNTFTIYSNSPNTTWQARMLAWPSLTVVYTSFSTYQSNQSYIWSYVPSPNNGYYVFQVRGTNSCGTTAWLPGYEVEYIDCSSFDQTSFVIYPNPASDIMTISLKDLLGDKINRSDMFEVSLYDQRGQRKIDDVKGTQTVEFNISNLENGFYFIHIRFNGELIKRQVRIER